MKIIIVGCGKVGYTLAEQLNEEGHDITIIDTRADKLNDATSRLDVIGMHGNGTSYSVQKEAGIVEANLLIAVTNMDEINLLCCLIAKKAGNCQTIARVRNPEYYSEIEYLQEELGLSLTVNPEFSAASDILHLIQVPSALEIDTFAKGRINMLKFSIKEGSPLCDIKVSEVAEKFSTRFLISIIERDHQIIIPKGNDILKKNDNLSIIIEPSKINRTFAELLITPKIIKNVMIFGGSTVAYYLAEQLIKAKINVKIIEIDRERCEDLSEQLPKAVIINADATKKTVLMEEGLPEMDAVVSLTNHDEENIMLSLYANKLSDAKIITKISSITFDEVLESIPIGSVISPKFLTTEIIIRYVRSMQNSVDSNVEAVFRLMDNRVEALEFYIKQQSRVTNIPLYELRIKNNLLVCTIIRGKHLFIPKGSDMIYVKDTVIIVTSNKGLEDIEDILQY